MYEVKMTISGKLCQAGQTFEVLNPATEEVIASCPDASVQQVDAAIKAAHDSFVGWRADRDRREQAMLRAADELAKHVDELAKMLTEEQGKSLADATGEVNAAVNSFRAFAKKQMPEDVPVDNDKELIAVRFKPRGVVACITPWNYPVSIAVGMAARALITGNTAVLKPSPFTPLATLRAGEILGQNLPAGVLNVISGLDQVAVHLTQSPLVKTITFTGSVATGKKIAGVAANDLKRVVLELGGNDPAIVMPGVNVQAVAEQVFWAGFVNNGQICIAAKRVYCHSSIYEEFVQEIAKVANSVRVGNGLDEGVQLGPLNNANQLKIVEDIVEDARKGGATIVTGGNPMAGKGYFYEPTIITNVKAGDRVVDEEQFGPVLPIISYDDLDDAIAQANAYDVGLAATVWSKGWQEGLEVADQIESGTVWVNRHRAFHPDAPFGGFKLSGVGRIGGRWGIEGLLESQTLSVSKEVM